MEKNYSIGDVARITGITEKQLRYWQDRGYIAEPQRVVCGERSYRLYSDDQVLFLKSVKTFLDEGYKLSRALQLANFEQGGESDGR